MSDPRYPDYDVLAKRGTLSWNEKTRQIIDARLALPDEPRFLSQEEWRILKAICARIVPQPSDRPPVPVAAFLDEKLRRDARDGYRNAKLPQEKEAWRRGLAGLNEAARAGWDKDFDRLGSVQQDALLRQAEKGELRGGSWGDMPSDLFFKARLLRDVVRAYYAFPAAWSEIGFGGPASPRGYVRMGFDQRDPWEAAEVRNGDVERARRENRNVG